MAISVVHIANERHKMDKTTLVNEYIEEGKRIIESLDQKSLDINAAMWFYLEDLDEWRLFIASHSVPVRRRISCIPSHFILLFQRTVLNRKVSSF
jgi:hypothetical protein